MIRAAILGTQLARLPRSWKVGNESWVLPNWSAIENACSTSAVELVREMDRIRESIPDEVRPPGEHEDRTERRSGR